MNNDENHESQNSTKKANLDKLEGEFGMSVSNKNESPKNNIVTTYSEEVKRDTESYDVSKTHLV